jgi:hypothetical protein
VGLVGLAIPGNLGAAPAPPPKKPLISALLRDVLQEVALPPLGGEAKEARHPLPDFTPANTATYAGGAVSARFRETLRQTQVAIWALSPTPIPAELAGEVQKARREMGLDLGGLKQYQPAPPAGRGEARFRAALLEQQRLLARVQARLEELHDQVLEMKDERERCAPRWQANHDLLLARLEYQIAIMEEHQFALGQMRKETPPLEIGHSGWRLVPHAKVVDVNARKLVRDAQRRFEGLAREHPDTVWAEMGRRAVRVPLGLEWQSVK